VIPLHLFAASLLGWLQREQHEIILYLRQENRVLKAHLRGQRVRLTDHERRRLAVVPIEKSVLVVIVDVAADRG
jgi:hypothetical protein